jgi:cell division protein FtsB
MTRTQKTKSQRTTGKTPAPVRRKTNAPPKSAFLVQLYDFLGRNTNAFLITGLALLLLQDIFGNHGVLAMLRSERQAADIRKQINQLDAENRKLQDRVKSLKSDPSAIERIAREEMGLARPGEYIFKIQPKPGEAADSAPESGTAQKP